MRFNVRKGTRPPRQLTLSIQESLRFAHTHAHVSGAIHLAIIQMIIVDFKFGRNTNLLHKNVIIKMIYSLPNY